MSVSNIPSIVMSVIWVSLGLKVIDVLYRLAKSFGSGFGGASGFFRSEFGNLSTLVLLACIVYLVRNPSYSKAA